jgi:signal peptidase I
MLDFFGICLEEAALEFNKSTVREYFESIVVTAIIALFAMTFVIQAYKIPTSSMENNLLIGDHLLVNKFVYGLHSGFLSHLLPYKEPKRGDVIVFKYPGDPDIAYVKRLIGLPGETIEMADNIIYITRYDNVLKKVVRETLKENYTYYDPERTGDSGFAPVNIPPDRYFAMGDNRNNSADSRYWGFVPRDNLLGKAIVIYWSFETDRNEYKKTSIMERLKQFYDVIRNFFSKTRWQRTFKIIR